MAVNNELERLRRDNEELRARLDADPYRKIEELGAGGFCTVWRASKRVDDRHAIEVCLKELKPHLREDPDSVRYFQREASIASDLRHGNIPLLIDVDAARYRLVYELVDGVDLRRLLEHAGGRLAPELVILVGLEIAAALEYAHSRTKADAPAAVIHRDLTPANVLVSVDGQVMLADFGVAAIESAALQTSIRGTTAYMSPEQARGLAVDAGTDLFSLGVVLHELLTGRSPFDGNGAGPIESLAPEASAALHAIITRLLQPVREDRYKSASDVFSALSELAPSHDVKRSLGALARPARRRKTKDYSTLLLAYGTQTPPLELAGRAHDPRAHEVTTLVRPVLDADRSSVAPARTGSARATRWVGAALVATLTSVMFLVSRSQSPGAREVVHADAASAPSAPASPPTPAEKGDLAQPAGFAEAAPSEARPALIAAEESSDGATSAPPAAADLSPAAAPAAAPESAPEEATLRVSADKSAPVHIDGRFVGWSPLKANVEPGAHTVAIGVGARQQVVRAQLVAGSTKNIFVNIRRSKPAD